MAPQQDHKQNEEQVTGTIDVHTHLYPRLYIDAMKRRGPGALPRIEGEIGSERFIIFPEEAERPGAGRPMGPEFWEVDAKLSFMDRFGIERSVVSLGNPWLGPFTPEESVPLARAINEELGGLEETTGGRLSALGALPSGDVDAIIREIEWIAAQPGLRGVITGTRIADMTLDDSGLDPIWHALQAHDLVIFVHPHHASALSELGGFGHGLPVALGFPFETSIALTRLTFAGVLERYPALRMLAAHGGGTIPFLAGRANAGWQSDPQARTRLQSPPGDSFRRLYLDAVVYHERALRTTVDLVGAEHVSFGTDHPFSVADPQANLDAIAALAEPDVQELVLSASARQLFRLP
jgi:aminocarboxymuconate-semialdehyde decarboxylase